MKLECAKDLTTSVETWARSSSLCAGCTALYAELLGLVFVWVPYCVQAALWSMMDPWGLVFA